MADIFKSLRILGAKVFGKPEMSSAEPIKNQSVMTPEDMSIYDKFGITMSQLYQSLAQATTVNYERDAFYKEIERAITYPLIRASLELYADSASSFSQLHNATVWVTANNKNYTNSLTKFFDFVGIEEKISSWAYNLAAYGDMFVELNAVPGKGIISVDDSFHPVEKSRVDHNGRLIGFYNTPIAGSAEGKDNKLIEPWKYIHFRLLGAKVKNPNRGGMDSNINRQVSLLGTDVRRSSTKYGDSVITNAIPVFKRLKLAEDSLMMSRLSKSILKYLYKVKVDGNNNAAIAQILNNYSSVLKRARSIDVTNGQESLRDSLLDMAGNEDLLVPVWGDTNDLAVEELGGKPDIQHIVDVDSLRNQLAAALRVPLQLLGSYTSDLPASLGQSSLERIDIRFAKYAHKLQRALIEGITRMCQIHLAFQNKNPDLRFYEVHMAETSSAEEVELKEALSSGVDIVDKLSELILKFSDQIDPLELFDYMNQKILKLNDLDLTKLKTKVSESKKINMIKEHIPRKIANSDVLSFLPKVKNIKGMQLAECKEWNEKYKNAKIEIKD